MKKIITLGLICLSTFLYATTITVNSASDIDNATPSPGDTLLMSKSADWSDQDLVLSFNGTSISPIVLLAEGNGEVILSGSSRLQYDGDYIVVNGLTFQNCASTEGQDLVVFQKSREVEFCRLTNCLFKNNNPSDLNVGYKWVSLHGENNRVDHCWFEEKKHRGTTVVVWLDETDSPNFHRIDHNYFTRPELSTGNNEAETIRIGDSKTSLVNSNTIVEYNYFEECDGEIESISNKSGYNIYRYNTFFGNRSILTLRHGHFCTVESNYFFGNSISGSGGVRIIGIGHKVIGNYMQDLRSSGNLRAPIVIMGGVDGLGINDATNRYVASEENLIAFNTIVNCNGTGIYVGSDKTDSGDGEVYKAPSNNTIENNVIYGSSGEVLDFEYGEIASFNYSGNIFNGISLGKSSSNGFTNIDPLLNFGTDLTPARIMSTSPAIDASFPTVFSSSIVSYSPPTEDMDGEQRNGTLDVGADEYYSSTPVREPILKTEVGPCFVNPTACNQPDCHGDIGGTASVDNCGVCSGGNTGVTVNNCPQDCNGEWNGTATIDACGVCSGGNTGLTIDACLECGPPIASSDDGNVSANVLDKDLLTRWSAEGLGEYIEICLDDTLLLNKVSIAYFSGDIRTSTFDLQVSLDGVNWTTVLSDQVTSGTTLDLEDYSIPTSEAWKIRIIGKGNSSPSLWNSITEVEWMSTVTGTNDLINDAIKIYPNPVNNTLFIDGLSNDITWNVISIQGSILISGQSESIDVSSLTKGIYILELSSGKMIKFKK